MWCITRIGIVNITKRAFAKYLTIKNDLSECSRLLNALHEEGFYKQCRFTWVIWYRSNGLSEVTSMYILSLLNNLKNLYIFDANGIADWRKLPNHCLYLQQNVCYYTSSHNMSCLSVTQQNWIYLAVKWSFKETNSVEFN